MESEKVATSGSKEGPKEKRKIPLWAERIGKTRHVPEDERDLIYETLLIEDDETGDKLRQKLEGMEYREWARFPNADLPPRLLKNPKAQRKYEIFCGGFLYFYDEELGKYPAKIEEEYPKKFPNEKFDGDCLNKLQRFFGKLEVNKKHKIFFDWGKEALTIYIKPEPGNPDPPPPPAPPPPESVA